MKKFIGRLASLLAHLSSWNVPLALKRLSNEWCQANGISGYKLRLTTQNDFEDYIISDRLEQQGISESITVNGVHYGIEVRGKVFDNLSSQGLSLEEWQADFHCPSDEFLITIIEVF
jgi:Papain fold toxin 2